MGELVVGVDGSAGSRAALSWAVEEAELRGDELAVITVFNRSVSYPGTDAAEGTNGTWATDRRGGMLLDEMLAAHRTADVTIKPLVLEGVTYQTLIERAAATSGLIVGSRGHSGFRGLLLGSVSQQVVVHARSPVVVVPPREAARRRDKVVVGFDGSSGAHLARAAEEARLRGWELQLVTVQPPPPVEGARSTAQSAAYAYLWMGFPPPDLDQDADLQRQREQIIAHWQNVAERQMEQELARLDPAALPTEVTREVIGGDHPARTLLDVAQSARLLVVGSRGLGGFQGMLLGSVSQHCVRHATTPVMVVPTDAA